jgi:hypothetical protein
LRIGIDRVAERVMTAGFEPGPVEIALNTEHERVDLPIGADLTAADETVLIESVVCAGDRIAPFRIGKAGAEIAADIEA